MCMHSEKWCWAQLEMWPIKSYFQVGPSFQITNSTSQSEYILGFALLVSCESGKVVERNCDMQPAFVNISTDVKMEEKSELTQNIPVPFRLLNLWSNLSCKYFTLYFSLKLYQIVIDDWYATVVMLDMPQWCWMWYSGDAGYTTVVMINIPQWWWLICHSDAGCDTVIQMLDRPQWRWLICQWWCWIWYSGDDW